MEGGRKYHFMDDVIKFVDDKFFITFLCIYEFIYMCTYVFIYSIMCFIYICNYMLFSISMPCYNSPHLSRCMNVRFYH